MDGDNRGDFSRSQGSRGRYFLSGWGERRRGRRCQPPSFGWGRGRLFIGHPARHPSRGSAHHRLSPPFRGHLSSNRRNSFSGQCPPWFWFGPRAGRGTCGRDTRGRLGQCLEKILSTHCGGTKAGHQAILGGIYARAWAEHSGTWPRHGLWYRQPCHHRDVLRVYAWERTGGKARTRPRLRLRHTRARRR